MITGWLVNDRRVDAKALLPVKLIIEDVFLSQDDNRKQDRHAFQTPSKSQQRNAMWPAIFVNKLFNPFFTRTG